MLRAVRDTIQYKYEYFLYMNEYSQKRMKLLLRGIASGEAKKKMERRRSIMERGIKINARVVKRLGPPPPGTKLREKGQNPTSQKI